MKKKIKHKRNLRKMTKLQMKIFDSQSERKNKQYVKKYHAKMFWHIGRYGGLRIVTLSHASKLLPKTDTLNFDELEARFRFLRKIKNMRLKK